MSRLFALAALCLCLAWPPPALAAQSAGPGAPALEITAPDPALAREIRGEAGRAAPVLRLLTGASPPKIRIEVMASLKEFQARSRQVGGPLWAAGLAIPAQGLILLRSPGQLTNPGSFGLVLVHEMTHLYLHAALGAHQIPLWLEEGIAMYAAGQGGLSQTGEMAAAVLSKKLIPLGKLRDSFPQKAGQARLAYAQSYYLVSYLLSTFGHDAPARIIRELVRGRELTVALKLVTGQGISALEKSFHQAMDSRFSWLAALAATGTIWGLAALLAGVGLVHRRRAQLREMQGTPEPPPYIPPGRRRWPPPARRADVLGAAGLGSKQKGY